MGKSEEHERPDKREVVEIYISNLKSSSCVYTVPRGVRYRPSLYCSRYIILSIPLFFSAGSLLQPVNRLQ